MADPFEYDVFISFSSADEELVKPIWQELCSNGLRVFWSDKTLKKEVGNSWFEIIEKSLERSKHMLLVCSENSMTSKWVQREYRAFFDYCYSPNLRRLIPILTRGFKPSNLPLFLRELQVGKIDDANFIYEIIPILGGTNIEQLRNENIHLKEQIISLSNENKKLKEKLKTTVNEQLRNENEVLKRQVNLLLHENELLKEDFGITAKEPDGPELTAAQRLWQQALDSVEKDYKMKETTLSPSQEQREPQRVPRTEATLYVGNLPYTTVDADIQALFSQAGTVKSAQVIRDRASGRSKGFALVKMSSLKEVQYAITMFHGKDYGGRPLTVKLGLPPEERPRKREY